ncbi:MAG: fumarylacetoacetate hydrolase family protein [Pirellulales bacterium]
MRLAKFVDRSGLPDFGLVTDSQGVIPLGSHPRGVARTLFDLLELPDPASEVHRLLESPSPDPLPLNQIQLVAPVDRQEIWAAGVTYIRSKAARMEESEAAASCYDRVYNSPRPELFFKATPHRVVGPGGGVRIRRDATWNVPEPELTLVLNSRQQLVGFTVGNDMSSRDIEGENPLYLPQAKVYDQCCGIGPWITLTHAMPPQDQIGIRLAVLRGGQQVYGGQTSTGQMARKFDDLIGWLGRDNSFPTGAMLLTGTGIVPDSDFTLQVADEIDITIDGIGTLHAFVIQG